MSVHTWKAQFYYPDAEVYAGEIPSNEVNLRATEHSIIKWEGLRKENLRKHKVRKLAQDNRTLTDGVNYFTAGGGSDCALCLVNRESCRTCPLWESRDGVACDQPAADEEVDPYEAWVGWSDPEPMIKALYAARTFVLKRLAKQEEWDRLNKKEV
jgi:hypothetical protein